MFLNSNFGNGFYGEPENLSFSSGSHLHKHTIMNFDLYYLLQHGSQICSTWMPSGEFHHLYSALVCGQQLPARSERTLFIDTGLIHILVVSGAHLHTLESLIQIFPSRVRFLTLGLYCWLCSFGAPVVRAWFRRVVNRLFHPLGASVLQLELVTIGLILSIHWEWVYSRSFIMSWLCALALSLPPIHKNWPVTSLSLYCYGFLFPLCPSAPTTILCNIMIAPLIGGFLFPLCALTAAFPALTPITNGIWRILLGFLEYLPVSPPAPWLITPRWLFLYPLLLHLILVIVEVPWRRARAFL